MGTSNQFGGARGSSALLPTFVTEPAGGAGGSGATDGTPANDDVPGAPPARLVAPVAGAAGRFTAARGNFSRFARSGGTDRQSLGRAVSQYVSTASGGSGMAARRMGSSRAAGAGFVNFLNDAATNGANAALRTVNLESLAGQPIERIFAGLIDIVCPVGGSIDDGIARDAFVETIADLSQAGITDLDGLNAAQIQTMLELYMTHTIEARICNDIGSKVVTLPADPQIAATVQGQLHDLIHRGVSDAINAANVNIATLTRDQVGGFITQSYQAAFEVLQTLGDREANQ